MNPLRTKLHNNIRSDCENDNGKYCYDPENTLEGTL